MCLKLFLPRVKWKTLVPLFRETVEREKRKEVFPYMRVSVCLCVCAYVGLIYILGKSFPCLSLKIRFYKRYSV